MTKILNFCKLTKISIKFQSFSLFFLFFFSIFFPFSSSVFTSLWKRIFLTFICSSTWNSPNINTYHKSTNKLLVVHIYFFSFLSLVFVAVFKSFTFSLLLQSLFSFFVISIFYSLRKFLSSSSLILKTQYYLLLLS